ncbi:benzoate/H(+) symporter BenE family transporter [Amaricoccus solimangrovi]|uniref:Benzoate/H(+) symporter BenE family transporter n=1 Tax=Amaricoccus solimangrovi TaxID=2589815 RepID=A0A501WPK5_9RHOB|nr:benzoate/H(+) symporter BenE family transporter [Amaricoccus solimangrovi]TPE48961.1 benzoate/H(+) symporter BenE family transporter [Amaricoccus solimangrovi]
MAVSNTIGSARGHWAGIVTAGFLVVLVSYAGPLLIYLQAAHAMGASPAEFSSWVFAISVAAGISSIVLSAWTRAPVATAWSAPGTVLLISLGSGLPFAEVVGAFVTAALVILALGVTGLFDRIVAAIPRAVADGMMAGILFGFGVHAMEGIAAAPWVMAGLLAAYFALSAAIPRYTMLALLALGLALSWQVYGVAPDSAGLALATPRLTWPSLSLGATLSLALPLVLTTLTGQFLPGLTILRASGYEVAARPIIVVTALASVAAAFLGGITTALAAITLALCAGPEAHPDPGRRWLAGVAAGVFFCLGGIFAGSIAGLLALLPVEIIAMLAGLALLGAILRSMGDMLARPEDAQAGLVTFIVTVTGVTIHGINAAFWGVVVGIGAVLVTRAVRRLRP